MNELIKQIAEFVRTREFSQGDQYGTWIAPSDDADRLADAILDKFIVPENKPTFGSLKPQ